MESKPSETALLIDLMRAPGSMDPADWVEAMPGHEIRGKYDKAPAAVGARRSSNYADYLAVKRVETPCYTGRLARVRKGSY